MKTFISGLLALAFALTMGGMRAYAGNDTVPFEPGVIKAALAKGETVLIHYKSTW